MKMNESKSITDRIIALEKLIIHHKNLYYKGSPEISDSEYDLLEEELKSLDPTNYTLSLIGPTNINTNANAKIYHSQKMLSLNKTYDLNDLEKWRQSREVVSTFKMDGVSCSIIYDPNGKISLAKTRGDGSYGEDITSKILWIKSVPKILNSVLHTEIEVRGELYCNELSFIELSHEMEKKNLERPTSVRNIVAGLMGRKDHLELSRYLNFVAFDIIGPKFNYEIEKYYLLENLKFNTPKFNLLKSKKEIEEGIIEAKNFMENGDSQIDGLVLTFNELKLHQELGETAHHPRYKIAFKFKGETKIATIKEISWSVSRNGILTPVAEINPIQLSSANISRVTLHNFGMVNAYKLKSGDKIEIIRSGEVIPKFIALIESADGEFSIPNICSSCGHRVEIKEIRLFCTNINCPARKQDQILNFIKNIGIEDLSEKRLEELVKKGLISDIPDLYDLKVEDFLSLDKIKDKLANKLYSSIQKTTRVELITFLSALGISGGAVNKCEKVVKNGYNTLEKVMNIEISELEKLNSFAQKSAEDFVTSLKSKKQIITDLLKKGFEVLPYKNNYNGKNNSNTENDLIKNKKFCITGALSEKRSIIEGKIKELGGVIQDSVSKNTDFLVTNEVDGNSSKFKKAKELNIEIINEKELIDLLIYKK
ncbi:MAG: NAD-dependent DNA ligase LigA [Oligoflexia bacterium]|nr:NAD-dependent DNA ligase LigA [Oligoflexia bacterium]